MNIYVITYLICNIGSVVVKNTFIYEYKYVRINISASIVVIAFHKNNRFFMRILKLQTRKVH
jgi:hypothetical protein